jgi:hypothetical protein
MVMELANFPQVPMLNNSPYSANWITYDIRTALVSTAPYPCGAPNYDMMIFSLHSDWDCSPEDVLAKLHISVWC